MVPSGQLAVSLQGTSEYTDDTRNYRNRLRTSISVYSCVCVWWIQCFELPCVTATFWLLIGWTGTFSSQGEEPEGSSHDPAATLQVLPWGQQWMKSSQHTAYRENECTTLTLPNTHLYIRICYARRRCIGRSTCQWVIYLWQRTAGPSSIFSLTARGSIWTARSAITGNIRIHWRH